MDRKRSEAYWILLAVLFLIVGVSVSSIACAADQPPHIGAESRLVRKSLRIRAAQKQVRFRLRGARYLAVQQHKKDVESSALNSPSAQAMRSLGRLVKISENDVVTPAVRSIDFKVLHFAVGPNGRLYVVPQDFVRIGGEECLFFEFDPQTSQAACLEKTWPAWPFQYEEGNGPLQFDSDNRVYYMVSVDDYCAVGSGVENAYQLKRYNGERVETMFSSCLGRTSLAQWVVTKDGTVVAVAQHAKFLEGFGEEGYSYEKFSWLLSISPEKVVTDLTPVPDLEGGVTFARLFPDGNVYVGLSYPLEPGVVRYVSATHELDLDNYWIHGWVGSLSGSYVSENEVYAAPGSMHSGGRLYRYFPIVEEIGSQLTWTNLLAGTANHLVAAGITSDSRSVLLLRNLATDHETILREAPPGMSLGIFTLLVSEPGMVKVSGVVHQTGEYFSGKIDVNNGTLTLESSNDELREKQAVIFYTRSQ